MSRNIAAHDRPPPADGRVRLGAADELRFLQRSIGNQAVLRLTRRHAEGPIARDRGDPLEQETERIAERVVRMPNPGPAVGAAPQRL